MPKYVIALENHDGGGDSRLHRQLADWQAQHLLDSVWLAELGDDALTVVRQLKRAADQDAAFAVFEIADRADWAVSETVYGLGFAWLQANL